MFENLGWGEIAVLLVLALFVFGPERLPTLAAEAGRGLRKVRTYVKGMTDDLKTELGPELGDVDLASLNGTGVGGRIRKQDVLAAAEAAKQAAETAKEAAAADKAKK